MDFIMEGEKAQDRRKTKAKPENLKHGGYGGKNRRKGSEEIRGYEAGLAIPCSCKAAVLLSAPHNPLISSDPFLRFFPSVPSVFQDFWF
jgi:hypothetical protein